MIHVALQLSVAVPRASADRALAFARGGIGIDMRHPEQPGRVIIDPTTQTARIEIAIGDGTAGFMASAAMPTEALATCLDDYLRRSPPDVSYAVIGLQFPLPLTLSQGLAAQHALEHFEDLVIEHGAGKMTVGRDAVDIQTNVMMPMIDPATNQPIVGGENWMVHGTFHLGGPARGDFLRHLSQRLENERSKN